TAGNNSDSLLMNDKIIFGKYISLARDEQFRLDERMMFANKALEKAKEGGNSNQIMEALSSLAFIDAQQGHYARAMETFDHMSILSDSVGYKNLHDWRRKAYVSNVRGLLYKELGEYDKALEEYYNSLSVSDSINWTEGVSTAMNNIAVLYNLHGNTPQAIKTLRQSWEIAEADTINSLLFDIALNMLEMYSQLKVFDSANIYGEKALQIAAKIKSPYNSAYTYLGFGKLYLYQKEYEKAAESLKKAIAISDDNGYEEIKLESLLFLAKVYRNQNKLAACGSSLDIAGQIDDKINLPNLHIKFLEQKAKLYEQIRDFEKAYVFYNKSVSIRDSINKSWENIKYSEIEALNELKFQKQKNDILEKSLVLKQFQLRNQRLVIIISLSFLIVILWFLFVLYRKRKYELRTNKLLQEQNERIRLQDKIIQTKSQESLKQELDYKNRQLTSFSLSALKQSESLDKVFQELRDMLNRQNIKPSTRKKLEAIIRHLKPHNTDKEWEEFRSYFEDVHPSFYSNLKKTAPDLSLNEQKICAYLRLGMNTKEIASITFRQVRSVESTRFRIRKKLNLTANDNLFTYLEGL
ncbi:MAG: tetratricopeptide repeat protein, partial [Chlorobi bacterium]|nr:tetratricopeptide repeat protein [Chlorobiota bacterium]